MATSLGGTTVTITDANSNTVPADLLFVSPTQVNFLVPSDLVAGQAYVEVASGDGTVTVGATQLANVAPGLFTADGRLAIGSAVQVDALGNQTIQPLVRYNNSTGQYVAVPISLGNSTTATYLILFGTGIRGAPPSGISVSIGDEAVLPIYAGIQPTFQGLDQVNVRIPSSLAGWGDVAVTLSTKNVSSNSVHVTIQ